MKYQNTLADNRVQCTICPRECILSEGQKGFCRVRENVAGDVTLTVYGHSTGFAIDPVEKKPLHHFLPGTKTLSFGTPGCNMGCLFCQNWHMTKPEGGEIDIKNLQKAKPEEIVQTALEYGCKSVSFTYNDPVVFFEYAVDTAKACHKAGLKTIAVTAGYINEKPRKGFFEHIDAANIDLKAFSEEFYKKNVLAHLEPVLDTLKYVKHSTKCHLEITTLLIPHENDSEDEIKRECEWILNNLSDDVPLHFSAFHPTYKFSDKEYTSVETLMKAYNLAKSAGLKYVYLGNIQDKYTSTTFCHNCLSAIIERDGYNVTAINLEGNKCKFCQTVCSGVFVL